MFASELRFYREIAPEIGLRVPECYRAEDRAEGTYLELEDLSSWAPGADPVRVADVLGEMHRRWVGLAESSWPWLRRADAGAELVGVLFDDVWPALRERQDVSDRIRAIGDRLYGHAAEASRGQPSGIPATLIHGDCSMRNLRTAPGGEIAFLDWEDVGAAPGVSDIAWFLLSSVEPGRWDEVLAAYGSVDGIADVLPGIVCQALLSLADTSVGTAEAAGWVGRIEAAERLATSKA